MLLRRSFTISMVCLVAVLWLLLAPAWLVTAALIDIARRRGAVALRVTAAFTAYLACELVGLALCAGTWLARALLRLSDEAWGEMNFRLEAVWGAALFRALERCFALELCTEGAAEVELGRGPYLLLVRHSSMADTLLASALISLPYRMRLRYVLKKELLWDPCLDIVGQRIPNAFVDRFAGRGLVEIEKIKALTRGLGERDGILIYPEGTRSSQEKRLRLIERLRERGDADLGRYAASLRTLLPPRVGGTVALLEGAPNADVIVCAHTGFEGTASLSKIWKGELVGRSVRVSFRRIARTAIPDDPDGMRSWLLDEWTRVDAWVTAHQHRT